MEVELAYAEDVTIMSAELFLNGETEWNYTDIDNILCEYSGLDSDLVQLTKLVLMGPAVVYLKTGIAV